MFIKERKNVKHFSNNFKQSSEGSARNGFQEHFLHHFFFLEREKGQREMKGCRSVRQTLPRDCDGVADSIVAR